MREICICQNILNQLNFSISGENFEKYTNIQNQVNKVWSVRKNTEIDMTYVKNAIQFSPILSKRLLECFQFYLKLISHNVPYIRRSPSNFVFFTLYTFFFKIQLVKNIMYYQLIHMYSSLELWFWSTLQTTTHDIRMSLNWKGFFRQQSCYVKWTLLHSKRIRTAAV